MQINHPFYNVTATEISPRAGVSLYVEGGEGGGGGGGRRIRKLLPPVLHCL